MKMAAPEIPSGLPFSKGGEVICGKAMIHKAFSPFEKGSCEKVQAEGGKSLSRAPQISAALIFSELQGASGGFESFSEN
jgi:hypothetical protein